MRIDRTDGIASGALDGARQGRTDAAAAGKQPAIDDQQGVVLERQEAPLIQQAQATPDINTGAVEEARKLLASGQLDDPAAIQRAAKAIIDGGL